MADENVEKKPKSKAKKVVSVIATVLLVVIVVLGIVAVVHIKTAKDPSIFGYSLYTVATGSMVPTLRVGDIILVKKVSDPSELQKGDIITFHGKGKQSGKPPITHRIISDGVEADGTITTCGDANHGIADDPITFDDVMGKLVRKSSFLYLLHSVFSSKVGFGLIIFLPLLVLLIVQVVNFVRACKMDKDGKVKGEEPEESKEETDRKLIEEYLKRQKRIKDAEKKHKK